ncbi:hypothetical protein [Rhodococcoides fascians]|nr:MULTISPECIES: hypothetical protein [Rhodococcus]
MNRLREAVRVVVESVRAVGGVLSFELAKARRPSREIYRGD